MRDRLLSLVLLLGACAGDAGPADAPAGDDTGAVDVGTPGPGAFDADFETSAEFFTRMAGPVAGGAIHGTVQIWYSTNLQGPIEADQPFTAPVGSVAIKVQDNGAESITVMVKEEPGFAPEHGDWSWEQRTIDGDVTNQGALAFCQDCHQGWTDTDYLAGTELL